MVLVSWVVVLLCCVFSLVDNWQPVKYQYGILLKGLPGRRVVQLARVPYLTGCRCAKCAWDRTYDIGVNWHPVGVSPEMDWLKIPVFAGKGTFGTPAACQPPVTSLVHLAHRQPGNPKPAA
jgi:hypothetical protein